MVDSTIMSLELVGELLSYLQSFKALPHGFPSVRENTTEVSLSRGYGHSILLITFH